MLDSLIVMELRFQLEMFQSQYRLSPTTVYFLVCHALYVQKLQIQTLAYLGKFRLQQFQTIKKTETVTFLKSAPNFF